MTQDYKVQFQSAHKTSQNLSFAEASNLGEPPGSNQGNRSWPLHTRTWRLNPTFPCYGSKPISGIIVLRHRHADLQTGSAFEAGYQTAWHPARGAIPQSNKQWVEMVVFMFFCI